MNCLNNNNNSSNTNNNSSNTNNNNNNKIVRNGAYHNSACNNRSKMNIKFFFLFILYCSVSSFLLCEANETWKKLFFIIWTTNVSDPEEVLGFYVTPVPTLPTQQHQQQQQQHPFADSLLKLLPGCKKVPRLPSSLRTKWTFLQHSNREGLKQLQYELSNSFDFLELLPRVIY